MCWLPQALGNKILLRKNLQNTKFVGENFTFKEYQPEGAYYVSSRLNEKM